MTDECELDQAVAEAVRAEALLADELLAEAFSGLEANYTAAWRATTIDDAAAREKLFLAINIVGKVPITSPPSSPTANWPKPN